MTPTSLHELLARLDRPFDVDLLRQHMGQVERAAHRERDGLRERLPRAASDLADAAAAANRRADEVETVAARTRPGFVATLLSSVDADGVEQARARAELALSGDLSVLERRMEDARALAEQVRELTRTAEAGVAMLGGLGPRAAAADVDPAEVATIGPALRAVAALPGQLRGLPAPLDPPLREALAVARRVADLLASMRSTGRAATVGEALLERVVGRSADGRSAAEVHAEVADERSSARDRARRDAELRRAAEAELDELES